MAAADARVRAFLAVELDAAARAEIAELVARFRRELPGVSWTKPENVHLTLRFLGHVEPTLVDDYVHRVRLAATAASPVEARISGLGAFPSTRRPSIVWAGMTFDGDAVTRVQHAAETAARDLGLKPETRPFTPHVTLGRVRRGARHPELQFALDRERHFSASAFTVGGVSLFSSELTPHGAQYTRLHRLSFDGIRGESGV